MKNLQLLGRIEEGTPPVVLDVRSRREFARGHVPGALHIPFWLMPLRVDEVPAGKGDPVVVYCGHGPRAWLARAVLGWNGFTDVALLEGHMSAWTRARLPEER